MARTEITIGAMQGKCLLYLLVWRYLELVGVGMDGGEADTGEWEYEVNDFVFILFWIQIIRHTNSHLKV